MLTETEQKRLGSNVSELTLNVHVLTMEIK